MAMRLVSATMLLVLPVASAWMVTAPLSGRAVGHGAACRSATLRMDDTVEPGFAAPEPQVNLQTVAPGCSPCTIKVIGVGGGGGNTLNRLQVDLRLRRGKAWLNGVVHPKRRAATSGTVAHGTAGEGSGHHPRGRHWQHQ